MASSVWGRKALWCNAIACVNRIVVNPLSWPQPRAWVSERLFRDHRRFRSDVSGEPPVRYVVSGWSGVRRKEPGMDRSGNEKQGENQGEGNRTAAREFNRAQEEFAKSGKAKEAARSAERALDTKEAKELKRAEELGR